MSKIAIAAALALGAAPALAQDGMVNVSVPSVDVLGDFISDDQAATLQDGLPITVQLPIGIAANACGSEADDLAKVKDGTPSCTAQNGSRALAEQVLKAARKPPKE